MAWLILILSALLEAVWATALSASEGFSRPAPTIVFFVAAALSMVGLSWAMRTIPVGSAYAVWTGLGAVLTAAWAMITGAEAAGVLKIVFLAGIIACVAGLRLVEGRSGPTAGADAGTGAANGTVTGTGNGTGNGTTATGTDGTAAGDRPA